MDYGINGIISSLVATSTFYPLDTIKSRKQAGLPIYNIKSMYQGIKPELISCVPAGFVYWYTYHKCRENNLSTTESSFISCITSNVIDTPFDIRKKRNQLNTFIGGNIYKYCLTNVMSSVVYNIFYLNTLKYLKNEKQLPNFISIAGASTLSSIMSYPLDRLKTSLVYPNKISIFKGLAYRVLYSNVYSGTYMNIFLWLNGDKVI